MKKHASLNSESSDFLNDGFVNYKTLKELYKLLEDIS